MKWRKLGQIYQVDVNQRSSEIVSHAANPLAMHLSGDVFRVFYSGRDAENKSSVGFVDIDIVKREVVRDENRSVFLHGDENSFYSHGVSIGNMYPANGEQYVLFMAWQIRGEDHWRGDVGRLKLVGSSDFELVPDAPYMTVDEEDQVSLSYPCVILEDGIYKMWYGSTIDWYTENGEMLHVIKYATSTDGENWNKHGVAIPYELGVAQAFSRPTVVKDDNGYHMWFSYRCGTGRKYRIGYSHSIDGIKWENQLDKVGIDVSPDGWDSEMICYPFVFEHKGERYMLYNGNSHGKEGFGLAILEK